MTELLFRADAYLKSCQARIARVDPTAVVLDRTVFYAAGGGQPGDIGNLTVDSNNYPILDTLLDHTSGDVIHRLAEAPPQGSQVIATLNWGRRHEVMRTHTALHLLYAAIQLPVTGGRMDPGRGRLDFDMPAPPDRDAIEARLAELIAADLAVTTKWVDWSYLDDNPELVKTMAVQPPRTQAKVSLVEIDGVDIQACGGTHVHSTSEIGVIKIVKVEKKGRLNRRIVITVSDA